MSFTYTPTITKLTTEQLVGIYNYFAKTPVSKFRDRATAEARVNNIVSDRQKELPAAMKKAGCSQEHIDFIERVVNPPVAPEPKPAPKAKAKAAPKPEAAPTEAEPKAKAKPKPITKPDPADSTPMGSGTTETGELKLKAKFFAVLTAIRELAPTAPENEVSSADVAKKIGTGAGHVIKCCDKLAKGLLITITDDSANDTDKFYYIKLTHLGKTVNVVPEDDDPAPLPGTSPGPRSNYAGKRIFKLVEGNPRREGTCGHKSFSLIVDGMTFEDYKARGGRNCDLSWDLDHGYVELREIL